jgi:aspartyl-tRNA(Asn)/glutamyl-tRNA(Gln) amidotransferase subunit A
MRNRYVENPTPMNIPNDPKNVSRRSFMKAALAGIGGPFLLSSRLTAASVRTRAVPSVAEEPGDELAKLSIGEAADLVRKKKVSPVQLTQACLSRIERLNPMLNAFITVTAESALAQAREAEAEVRRGRWRGALHGIPIGLKDMIDTAGVLTTAASGVFEHRVPDEDADVVRRLKAAGAVLIGKLNMHEFAVGATSGVSFFGPVRNPWAPAYMSGGSSGGSASAVAAGLCFAALGSDTGGSIREPSSYCGITGLKPTYGRVSTRGTIPFSWSLDHIGPMTRTVRAMAILLQAIAGHNPEDPTSAPAPVPNYVLALGRKPAPLRLGKPSERFWAMLDPEVEAAVNRALVMLSSVTAGIREIELPAYPNLPVLRSESYAYHVGFIGKTPELYQADTLASLKVGASVTAADYISGRREVDRLRLAVRRVFQDVDLLVTPTSPIPAGLIVYTQENNRLRNTAPFDVYGLPAISIPCGFTATGLPIGLQIVGPPWGETIVLQLAGIYQTATDWHRRAPNL